MKKLDYGFGVLLMVALVVLAFFWKCKYDFVVTIVAAVILAASFYATHVQFKKIKELGGEENQSAE